MEKRNKIIISLIIKIILAIFLSIVNYISFIKYYIQKNITIDIINGNNEQTTIGIGFAITDLIIIVLSIIFVISLIILIVFDFIILIKNKLYDLKFKIKFIISINLIILIATIFEIMILLLFPSLSIILNILLLSILCIIIFFGYPLDKG